MQKIIKNTELTKYIDEAITILSDAVKTTLGPNGNNVIISDYSHSPYITNDGVTIASSISHENEIIDTILSIIKEAALKTDSDIGDGTTTTIVLLESIYKNSLKYINSKNEALKLKEELQKSAKTIIDNLNKFSHIPTDQELEKIASISANDSTIGHLITHFYLTLNKSDNIKLRENTQNSQDYVQKLSGYFWENSLASPYFFKEKEVTIKKPIIILFNRDIFNMQEIEQIIYNSNQVNKNLIIIADSFSEDVINNTLALNYETNQKVILINNPEYGTRRLNIIEDLKSISQTKKIGDYFLGYIDEFKIDNSSITFYFSSVNLDKYIDNLNNELSKENDEYEQAFLKDRISKLTSTYGLIFVGGATKIERQEKKMRFTDALCALKASKNGIVPGSALPFYQISEELEIKTSADAIMKEALKSPFIQILTNSNIDYHDIIKEIKNSNYKLLFNAQNKTFEPLINSNVLDNKDVLIYALTNAVSIASLLLTTSHLVINTKAKVDSDNFTPEI